MPRHVAEAAVESATVRAWRGATEWDICCCIRPEAAVESIVGVRAHPDR